MNIIELKERQDISGNNKLRNYRFIGYEQPRPLGRGKMRNGQITALAEIIRCLG